MSSQEPLTAPPSISPHSSSTPLISTAQRQDLEQASLSPNAQIDEKNQKASKRSLFGLGKKKENKAMEAASENGKMPAMPLRQQQQQQSGAKPSQPIPLSPSRLAYQPAIAASPSRLRSSSPRLHSPGNSEIFERNVQEPIAISNLQGELSPAHIPAHVMTEDAIPPALEASAQAITSNSLNPDEVEIVTSSSHQPAASGIDGSSSHADLTLFHAPPLVHHNKSDDTTGSVLQHSGSLEDDGASSYGQLDPTDVRRLSFISFKDIVQSEHNLSALGEAGSRDSLHIHDRAGSPFRSPRSPTSQSQSLSGLTTPPTGVNINPIVSTAEQSPARSIAVGSPGSQHGDLNIETMRQALRKTASGDLQSGGRSAGMSPSSDAASTSFRDVPRSRTNT